MGRIRKFIETDLGSSQFSIYAPDSPSQDSEGLFDPAHSPLIGYRYVYHPEDYEHRRGEEFRYQNDCAFLPFRANKRDEVENLKKDLKSYNLCRQDKLKETSYGELRAYHANATGIKVKGFYGKLDPSADFPVNEKLDSSTDSPDNEKPAPSKPKIGKNLRFVLDQNW